MSRATTSAATRRGVPAATSSATAVAGLGRIGHGRSRAEHQRDLALRRLGEALCELRARCRARPPRSASSAHGRRRPRAPGSNAASERSDAGRRWGDSKATTGQLQRAVSRQSASSSPPSAAGTRRTRSGHRRARSRRARSRPRTGPGSTVTSTPASSAARTSRAPGSETRGMPASVTSAIRSPASSRGRSSATRAASLCSW